MPGWPTCACSYGKLSSHLGGISAKSSDITPRLTSNMNKLYFYKSFLKTVRSHLGKPVHLTGPDHLHLWIAPHYSLSFAFIRCATHCHSLYHSLPFFVTRSHSLSLVVIRCHLLYYSFSLVVIRCHLLSFDVSLVCLFINDLRFPLLFYLISTSIETFFFKFLFTNLCQDAWNIKKRRVSLIWNNRGKLQF